MRSGPIRRVAASGLVALGVLCAWLTGVFGSVDSHFHDADQFFANTESLADNAGVRERLFDGFRTEIISIADGADLGADGVEEDVPVAGDDADGDTASDTADAAVPVTDARIERDQVIESVLVDVLDSELYGEVFDEQLKSIQGQLVRSAELPDEALLRDPGAVTFDARRLYQPIYAALAEDPKTADITRNEVPDGYGVYAVADRETTINAAWWLVENGPGWRGLTYALAVLSFIGAVVVAERRPTRVIQFGAGIIGLALVVIVIVYIVRALVPLLADGSGGDAAVTAVYAANTSQLVASMVRLLIVGAVMVVVGGVARLIWPDDWVYGQVSDDRGVRSVRRRRGGGAGAEPAPTAQPQPAAMPGYPGYPPYGYPQPGSAYPGHPYPAPYPGQPYGGQYPPGYPVGPYAQPGPPGYATGAGGSVPVVMPPDAVATGESQEIVVEANDRPSDAAGIVPKVASAKDTVATSQTDDEPTELHNSAASDDSSDGSAKGDGWDDDGDW